MKVDRITLYPDHPQGSIEVNRVGAFMHAGEGFDVIRPGYDVQGRPRANWTQFVHAGVPIFEHKLEAPLPAIIERFERLWDEAFAGDEALLEPALRMVKQRRITAFRDGETSLGVAPSVTRDGRGYGEEYIR